MARNVTIYIQYVNLDTSVFTLTCSIQYLFNGTYDLKKVWKIQNNQGNIINIFIYIVLNFTEIYTFISGSLNFLIHLIKIYLGVNNNILKQDIFVFKNAASLFSFFSCRLIWIFWFGTGTYCMEMGCNRAIYLSLGLAGIVHYPVTTSHLLKKYPNPYANI